MGQNGQAMLLADGVRDLPQLLMLLYAVSKLVPASEGDGVHNEVAMGVVRVQVGGDQDLEVLAPHTPGGLQADLVGFLRRDLPGLEGLVAVVGNDLAPLPEPALHGHHLLISEDRRTVDSRGVLPFVSLVIVFGIPQDGIEIIIHILPLRGFIRVVGIVQDLLQLAPYGPEASSGHTITSLTQRAAFEASALLPVSPGPRSFPGAPALPDRHILRRGCLASRSAGPGPAHWFL